MINRSNFLLILIMIVSNLNGMQRNSQLGATKPDKVVMRYGNFMRECSQHAKYFFELCIDAETKYQEKNRADLSFEECSYLDSARNAKEMWGLMTGGVKELYGIDKDKFSLDQFFIHHTYMETLVTYPTSIDKASVNRFLSMKMKYEHNK